MKNIHTTPDSKLFSLDNSNPNKDWVNREELNNNAKIEGAREAARANCDISVLKMWFNKIYQQIREGIQNQSESQKLLVFLLQTFHDHYMLLFHFQIESSLDNLEFLLYPYRLF